MAQPQRLPAVAAASDDGAARAARVQGEAQRLRNDNQAARVLAADAKQEEKEQPSEEEKRRLADEQLPSACEVIAEVVARPRGGRCLFSTMIIFILSGWGCVLLAAIMANISNDPRQIEW